MAELGYERYVVLFGHLPLKNGYQLIGDKGKARIYRSVEDCENAAREVLFKNKLKREDCDWIIFRELPTVEYSNL